MSSPAGLACGVAILCLVVPGLQVMGFTWVMGLLDCTFAGWIRFGLSRFREISPVWSDVVLGGGLAVMFSVGVHLFISWLRQACDPDSPPWRVSWTLRGVAALLLLLIASTAMLGVIHQAVWMFTTEGTLIEEKFTRSGQVLPPDNRTRS